MTSAKKKIIFILSISFWALNSFAQNQSLQNAYSLRESNGMLAGASIGFYSGDNSLPIEQNFGEAKSSNDFYEIGSVSKSFTGILLSKLALAGKIHLNSPISEIIPELKGTFAGSVTPQLLATHHARFENYVEGDFQFGESDLISYLKKYVPNHTHPVGKRSYSNLGFTTLALIIRRVTRLPFSESVKMEIFSPLKMLDSNFLDRQEVFKHILQPHNVLLEKTHYDLLGDLWGASGGVYSNLSDMMKFLRANLHPDSIPSLKEAIQLSHQLGLGWDSEPNSSVVWKNGAMSGFGSMLEFNQSSHAGAVVLCNSRCTSSAMGLAAIALGVHDSFKPELNLSASEKKELMGSYSDAEKKFNVEILITDQGFLGVHARLANSEGYESLRLRQFEKNRFIPYDGIGITAQDYVEFWRAPSGKLVLNYFEFIQGSAPARYSKSEFIKQ